MHSSAPRIERARPLLGTTVAIRVEGLSESEAHAAIDEAFDAVALVHRLMSFQEPSSDISRLNREAFERTQDVHPATFEVLHWARAIAKISDGIFDITIAPRLVACELLPKPASAPAPDSAASWRDVELGDDYTVRFRKPLWVDVSGIAKGYAVDRAIETLQSQGAVQASVNAGGDLRIIGPQLERVELRADLLAGDALPVLEIRNAAVAGSGASTISPPIVLHVDPRSGASVSPDRFVSVIAESCIIADALTKPALILGEDAAPLLAHFGAVAHLHEPNQGWRHLMAAE
jgi:thiamine biosynthesis lipoprotein